MKTSTRKLTLSALFLALGLVLPLITGQIPQIGKMLETLADADFALKSTGTDERVALEETITKLFLLTGKR